MSSYKPRLRLKVKYEKFLVELCFPRDKMDIGDVTLNIEVISQFRKICI